MIKKISLIVTTISAFLLPEVTLAQTTVKLFQDIPFIGNATNLNIENYVNALYQAAIGIAAVLVVIKLILAGVKYMFSEVVTDKASAKADIRGSLLGLIIVLGAVTILNTINPDLTKLDFLERASRPCSQVTAPNEPCVVEVDTTSHSVGIGGEARPGTTRTVVGGDQSKLKKAQDACTKAGNEYGVSGNGHNKAVICYPTGAGKGGGGGSGGGY